MKNRKQFSLESSAAKIGVLVDELRAIASEIEAEVAIGSAAPDDSVGTRLARRIRNSYIQTSRQGETPRATSLASFLHFDVATRLAGIANGLVSETGAFFDDATKA